MPNFTICNFKFLMKELIMKLPFPNLQKYLMIQISLCDYNAAIKETGE